MAVNRLLLMLAACMLLASCQVVPATHQAHQRDAADGAQPTMDRYRQSSRQVRGGFKYDWQLVEQVVPLDEKRLQAMAQLKGQWRVDDGKLVATEGLGDRAIILTRQGVDPLRIEMEVSLQSDPAAREPGRIGDITLLLATAADSGYWRAGYALTTGSYWNQCSTFYRQGVAIAHTEYSPLVEGRRHRVVVEYDAGHIRYQVDGRIVLEAWDDQPLKVEGDVPIGLRTWETRLTVHDLKIHTAAKR